MEGDLGTGCAGRPSSLERGVAITLLVALSEALAVRGAGTRSAAIERK